MTRSMGRRESDSSPIISLVNFCPATMPLSMRMVEPELPQSSEFGRRREGEPSSLHFDDAVVPLPGYAEGAHAAERAGAVGSGGIIFEARRAFGDSGEHGVAVGDGFVSGQLNAAADVARRAHDDLGSGFHAVINIKGWGAGKPPPTSRKGREKWGTRTLTGARA